MKTLVFLLFCLFVFSGCTSSTIQRVHIDNYGLCNNTISSVVLDSITIDNKTHNLLISKNDIKTSLEKALAQSGCFHVYGSENNQILKDQTYILNVKATAYQETDTVKQNIFKKDNQEKLIMVMYITAHSGDKTIQVSSKSEVVTKSSKILGFEKDQEFIKDKTYLIESASKNATIALQEQIK